MKRFIRASRLMMAANMLGLPAAVLPVDNTNQGAAVQIIGPRFAEGVCWMRPGLSRDMPAFSRRLIR
ncbi:MAG: hypothetical protein K9K82_07300 [Desulfobacteraceae bacterium]|nr:hypothetical protein [Desulfobacteraceae bacterium]